MANLTPEQELQKSILEFNKNPENQKLIDYYTSKSFFEILSIPRRETVHSSFIAWILEGKDFSTGDLDSPVMGLLDIISEKSLESEIPDIADYSFPKDLLQRVMSRSATVIVDKADTEEGIDSNNIPDILLRCTVNYSNRSEKLLIVIENKIKHIEGQDGEQTQNYFNCITDDGNKKDYNNFPHKIFVYLTPFDKGNPSCKQFVHITYQDIMDRILDPLSNSSKLSDKAKVLIQDYIKTLSVPALTEDNKGKKTKKNSVLAIGKVERGRLVTFAENNQELIKNLFDNYTNPIVRGFRDKYKHLLEAVLNILKTQEKDASLQNSINYLEYLCTSGTHIVSIEFLKSGTKIWKVGTMTDISEFIILNLWEYYKNQKEQNIFQKVKGIVDKLRIIKRDAYVLCESGHSSDNELTPDKTQPNYKVYVFTQWRLDDGISSSQNVKHDFHYPDNGDDGDVEIILKRI